MVDMWGEMCLEKWKSVERKRLSEGKLCRNLLFIYASRPERRHSNSFLVAVQSLLPVKTSVCKQNPLNFYFCILSLIVGSWQLNFVSMPSDKCKTFILCTTTVIIALLLCDLCIYNIKQSTWEKCYRGFLPVESENKNRLSVEFHIIATITLNLPHLGTKPQYSFLPFGDWICHFWVSFAQA